MACRTTMVLGAAALGCAALPATADPLGNATADDPIELTLYYPIAVGGALEGVMDDIIAGFEDEHPHIAVEAVYSGNYDETMVQAQSAISAGDPPATTVLGGPDMYDLIAEELIVPFDDVVETEAEREWLDSFYDAFMDNSRDAGGRTWGIPFQRSTVVQYWNKEAFEAAGLDRDQAPQSWDELREIAAAVQDGSDADWGVQMPSSGFPYWLFQAFTTQNGIEIVNAAGNETYFDDPAAIAALEFWLSLAEDGVHPDGIVDWGTTPEDFLQGETAMIWTTTGNLTNIRDNAGFEFGVDILPGNVQRGSAAGGGNFYLFADAPEDEQRAAMALIRYMTAPEQLADWTVATGYVAPTPEAWETDTLRDYVADFPEAAVARDQLDYTVRELATYEVGSVYRVINDALQAALVGDAAPAEALSEAQAEAETILAPYR